MDELILYSYFRSSCSYRVRIALALKELPFDYRYIHLLRQGGENWHTSYLQINPQGLLPALQHNEKILSQSLAIIEYLDESFPQPPLLPGLPLHKAWVRAVAQTISCDIQPVNNLQVLDYLRTILDADENQCNYWVQHWIVHGLNALEKMLEKTPNPGLYCYGDMPGLADVCLIPQVYNAMRYAVDLTPYPAIQGIYSACMVLPAFQQAEPESQLDAG